MSLLNESVLKCQGGWVGGGGRGWRGEGMRIGVMIGNKCLFELFNFRIPEEAEFEDCKSFYE